MHKNLNPPLSVCTLVNVFAEWLDTRVTYSYKYKITIDTFYIRINVIWWLFSYLEGLRKNYLGRSYLVESMKTMVLFNKHINYLRYKNWYTCIKFMKWKNQVILSQAFLHPPSLRTIRNGAYQTIRVISLSSFYLSDIWQNIYTNAADLASTIHLHVN